MIRISGRIPNPVSLAASGVAQDDIPAAKQIVDDTASLKSRRLHVIVGFPGRLNKR